MIKIDTFGEWRRYWGAGPLPDDFDPLGIVWKGDGVSIEAGALFQSQDGRFWVGNNGALKGLPTRETARALAAEVN